LPQPAEIPDLERDFNHVPGDLDDRMFDFVFDVLLLPLDQFDDAVRNG
jgi:hypothetical protein